MTTHLGSNAAGPLLSDAEVEEFRRLARDHAGAELTANDARAVADQLIGVLSIVRDIVIRSSTDSTSSVDRHSLPET